MFQMFQMAAVGQKMNVDMGTGVQSVGIRATNVSLVKKIGILIQLKDLRLVSLTM